ncbi:uncharacterized protein LOC133360562 [Lethenteron reissneri]|uniref:uncharacterized protein LOC133360562 n=1 Tax=Lethenteron reissneri TaxID=7753 RepID=UPI002AB6A8EE|nr:uncharacterized protein LOC133360562 [Lethenteron reissneri]
MAQSCPEKEMLRALETECKVVVKVTNASRLTLCEPRVFIKSGYCQFKSDESIKPKKHALYGFRKMTANIKGCHGILGLRFQGTDEYFVLLFKNPYLYNRKLFSLSIENNPGICDIDLRKLQEMSRKEVSKDGRFAWSYAGSNCLIVKSRMLQVQVKAAMSASDESVVYMTVTDEGTGEGTNKPVTKDSSVSDFSAKFQNSKPVTKYSSISDLSAKFQNSKPVTKYSSVSDLIDTFRNSKPVTKYPSVSDLIDKFQNSNLGN